MLLELGTRLKIPYPFPGQGDCVSKILRENDLRFRQLMPVGFVLNFSLFHKSDFTG